MAVRAISGALMSRKCPRKLSIELSNATFSPKEEKATAQSIANNLASRSCPKKLSMNFEFNAFSDIAASKIA